MERAEDGGLQRELVVSGGVVMLENKVAVLSEMLGRSQDGFGGVQLKKRGKALSS